MDDEGVVRCGLGVPVREDLEGIRIDETIVIEGLAGDLGGCFRHAVGSADWPAEGEGFFEEIGLDAATANEDQTKVGWGLGIGGDEIVELSRNDRCNG